MKNAVIIAVIVALAALAAYFYFNPVSEEIQQENTPANSETAKININAVCEGALAYMTFPDGASAEAFVADCKEGKHPEVIEKYKADMHLDGAAI
jgi:flagellar basal body-associated protein FliL